MSATSGPGEAPTIAPADYPITLRPGTITRIAAVSIGMFLVLSGLLGARLSLSRLFDVKLAIFFLIWSGMGVLCSAWVLSARVVLSGDRIEDKSVLGTRRFAKSDIAGKKVYTTAMGAFIKTVVVYPASRDIRPMKIEMSFKPSTAFDAWIDSLPDILEVTAWSKASQRLVRRAQIFILVPMVLFNVLVGNVICFGYGGEGLHPIASFVSSSTMGERDPPVSRGVFALDDTVIVRVVLAWPNARTKGGSHRIAWRWYRGGEVVYKSRRCNMLFEETPWTLETWHTAESLGVGHFRVVTLVDGSEVGVSEFDLVPASLAPRQHANFNMKLRILQPGILCG